MRILLTLRTVAPRLRFHSLGLILGLSLALLHPFAACAQAKFARPIMMDSSGPDLFVVDVSGTMHEFHISQNHLEEYRDFPLPSALTPADMSYGTSNGQEFILIAGSQASRGIVAMYALDGKSLRTWNFRNICSGIDFDTAGNTAYVAMSDSNEIYHLDLKSSESTYVTRIPNATKLGPLAVDGATQTIYVADVAAGSIYQYSLTTKSSKVLASGLSTPTSLSFEPETGQLYFADPGRRAVFRLDTRSNKPVATEFVSNPLRSPYSMARTAGDQLAVADYGASSILVFSGKGSLLFKFPPAK
jgi:DNA-binding beta-propeller fold protein YncE